MQRPRRTLLSTLRPSIKYKTNNNYKKQRQRRIKGYRTVQRTGELMINKKGVDNIIIYVLIGIAVLIAVLFILMATRGPSNNIFEGLSSLWKVGS